MISHSQLDDPTLLRPLPDELVLWRRVSREWVIEETDSDGAITSRPSSACFTDNLSDGTSMSVFDSESCGGLDKVLEGHTDFGVASVTVGQVRANGLTVSRTAIGGPGHCEVHGKKTRGIMRNLAKSAVWVKKPDSSS